MAIVLNFSLHSTMIIFLYIVLEHPHLRIYLTPSLVPKVVLILHKTEHCLQFLTSLHYGFNHRDAPSEQTLEHLNMKKEDDSRMAIG